MVKKAAEPRKSASTGSGARAKPKADAKTEAKAGSVKQAKRAGRGPAEPLTVNQYDVLTDYVKWRYPRAPEKRTKGAKMPASLRPRVKAAFRTVKNFNCKYSPSRHVSTNSDRLWLIPCSLCDLCLSKREGSVPPRERGHA